MMLLSAAQITFYYFILLVCTAQNFAIVANHICNRHKLLNKGVSSVHECANLTTNSSLCNSVDFYMGPSLNMTWECYCCTGLNIYHYTYEEGYNLYSILATASPTLAPTNLPSSNTNNTHIHDNNTTEIREVYQCSGPAVEGSIRLDMHKCMDQSFTDPCGNKCYCTSPHEIATGEFCGKNCVLNNRSRQDFECISTWNYIGDGECVQVEQKKQLDITFYWGWVDDCNIEANRRPDVVAYSTIYDDTMWYQRDYQCLLYSDNTTMSGNHTCDWPRGTFFTPEGPCTWSRAQKEDYCNLKDCRFQASYTSSGFSCYLRKDRFLAQQPIGVSYDKWMICVFSIFAFGCLFIVCYAVRLKRKIKDLKDDFKAHVQTTLAPGLLSDEDMEGLPEIDWKKLKVARWLGKGSFGKVFCVTYHTSPSPGEDTEPESYVYAVKVLHNMYNNEQREHFKNEIRLMQQGLPVHTNVVPIMGITKEAGTVNVGLLMPYYEMGSLHDHLYDKNSENFTTTAKLWIIFDIASGLNHLHANGVIHRDIAARNILLFKDMNRVNGVITDFGMAILASDTNEEGRLNTNCENKNFLGPLKWMAKECLQEHPEFSFKSDVYSFAITCWEIMTGKIPWENMSAKEAARYAFDGARPPRFGGLKVRARRDSILTESMHLSDNLNTTHILPPNSRMPRRLSASSNSTTFCNISQIGTIDVESDYESVDQQIRDSVWHLIDQCWKPEPEDRPSIGEVKESIQTVFTVIGTEDEVYNAFQEANMDTYDLISPRFMNENCIANSSSEKNSPKAKNECGPVLII